VSRVIRLFSVVSQSSQKGFEIFETICHPVDVLSSPDFSIFWLLPLDYSFALFFSSLLF
jgi:hypothetical protein